MDIFWQLFWIIIGCFIGFLIDIVTPEKIRIKILLFKKKLSKWVKNQFYNIGFSTRFELKRKFDLDTIYEKLKEIFKNRNPSFRGTEIHFDVKEFKYEMNVKIQLDYSDIESEEVIMVEDLLITIESFTKYRELKNFLFDLIEAIQNINSEITNSFDIIYRKKTLFVKINGVKEFSEILQNLKAQQITGIIRESDVKFVYFDNKLTIEDSTDSKSINWLKDIIAYVG